MGKRMTYCPLCGGHVEAIVIKEFARSRPDGTCVFFENVAATRCSDCGELFFADDVMQSIQKKLRSKSKPKRIAQVPVYTV